MLRFDTGLSFAFVVRDVLLAGLSGVVCEMWRMLDMVDMRMPTREEEEPREIELSPLHFVHIRHTAHSWIHPTHDNNINHI